MGVSVDAVKWLNDQADHYAEQANSAQYQIDEIVRENIQPLKDRVDSLNLKVAAYRAEAKRIDELEFRLEGLDK